ncbi:CRISPR-associated endonuclease Cas3'' [Streptomyces hoynatensis]|uniref:CRISPR-associated endonuclease Cas3 n=1 Tax=Streptomyces hoynatensis TaxID=1141874 RepID=A0A3A9YTF6_9ACTN|nr:CRISPR-associated endonuclease Cas3'' [Streptomyces hoynatensis]RKN39245.1 CRISPR-associated endonuclease Cas3'' [Streptomyces hoynatensis]
MEQNLALPGERGAPSLLAHSRSKVSGLRHGLEAHLRGSAALARRFGDVFAMGELAAYLALVHDVGKGCRAWRQALLKVESSGGRVGVPHKEAGARLAAEHLTREFGAVVYGHHGGLPDQPSLKGMFKRVLRASPEARAVQEAIDAVERLVPEIRPRVPPAVPQWVTEGSLAETRVRLDLLLRMLFSCLVDADYLDTEAHFDAAPVRLGPVADMQALTRRFERRREEMLAERAPSPMDAARQKIYELAVRAAAGEPGMYRLHVPTGGAKTLAAGGFALHHAAAHGMDRVITAVPFTSITEQNAAVYRRLLDSAGGDEAEDRARGEWVVLEHHSSVDLDSAAESWARLAAENWDAPFAVTTTVQLFESLFSHRPAAMRKLHRLAGAVIVLDEVQALPDRLLVPILSGLRGLVEHFGTTVVLSSATQPEFGSLPGLQDFEIRDIVEEPAAFFEELRRVRYEWRLGEDVTWTSIAEEMVEHEHVLAVVNTTDDAATLHRLLQKSTDACVLHLSRRMTAEHRRETIEAIRRHLAIPLPQRPPLYVVSTTLIEAGVDLDFPCVYRAWAPVESFQQAAGRCNRDMRLDGLGTVVIFRPTDGKQPKDPSRNAAMTETGNRFGPDLAAPDDLSALAGYYRSRFVAQQAGAGGLGREIEKLRVELDFPEVDRKFRMIEDEAAAPVVVIRTEEQRQLVEEAVKVLRDGKGGLRDALRRLRPHTATLPRHQANRAVREGLAEPVIGDLLLWVGHGQYHDQRGLEPDAPEDREDFTV